METDQDLVLGLRKGDRKAFEILYQRHKGRIWRFLVRLAGNVSTAEDLFQEVWLSAARNAHLLREDSAPLPWLYTIARNKHRNARRFWAFDRQRRRAIQASPPEPVEGPEDAAHSRIQVQRLDAAFSQLPEAYREVLLLCVTEGLESGEAGSVLGLSPEATRKRLSRARAELARVVGSPDRENGMS